MMLQVKARFLGLDDCYDLSELTWKLSFVSSSLTLQRQSIKKSARSQHKTTKLKLLPRQSLVRNAK
ncbi:hypothetical protein JG688_00018011, partial [Phytophthora aleatoria]